jgi:hypothetical protein
MTATEIRAVLDAHDALLRSCVDGRLTFPEFLGAYGDFPRGYGLEKDAPSPEEREVLRLFRKRVAFHGLAADVISASVTSCRPSGSCDCGNWWRAILTSRRRWRRLNLRRRRRVAASRCRRGRCVRPECSLQGCRHAQPSFGNRSATKLPQSRRILSSRWLLRIAA